MTKPLTIKQILDKSTKGVMDQGQLSKASLGRGSTSCYYRHPRIEGCACGVGHLIDDDHYDKMAENVAAYALDTVANPSIPYVEDKHYRLAASLALSGVDFFDDSTRQVLVDLQEAHDCAKNLEGYRKRAANLYKDRRLAVPEWLK